MTNIFIISFLGSFFAGLIVALVDARFRHPGKNYANASTQPHPYRTLLRISAFVVAGAWTGILAFFLFFVLRLTGVYSPTTGLVVSLFVFFLLALAYMPLAFSIRCQSCRKHILVQWNTEPRYAQKSYGMDGWASIIVRILKREPFRCMYCGQSYSP